MSGARRLFAGALPLAFALALPAGGETSPAALAVDQLQVCSDCHAEVGEAIAAPVAHPPAQTGECTACHNPHAGREEGLLLARPALLCAECHQEITAELARPILHRPVAEGRCIDCHQPHGGEHAGLLTAPGSELCASCHEQIGRWQALSVRHSPFERGRCAACHEPHGAEHAGLATQPGGLACLSCHPASAKFRRDHGGYPVEQAECQQCHDPHASSRQGLFLEQTHPPFELGDCTDCHAAPGAEAPFALAARQDRLCGDCHEEQVEASQTAPFPHLAAGGAACTACHNPHGGSGEALLREGDRELCLSCHDPGGASSGQAGRYASHGDLSCTDCHGAHGGDRPLFLNDEPVVLCGECHSHQHSINHPMGAATPDPRNGQPMDCLSCHGVHDAPHEKYLYRGGERELCIGCHKQMRAPR